MMKKITRELEFRHIKDGWYQANILVMGKKLLFQLVKPAHSAWDDGSWTTVMWIDGIHDKEWASGSQESAAALANEMLLDYEKGVYGWDEEE
jgi:hypothetical protein